MTLTAPPQATGQAPPAAVPPPPAAQPSPPPRSNRSEDRTAILPSALAALCVLAGATALTAILTGGGWVVPLIEVVAVIWLLGVGCRMLRIPSPLTVLIQFVGMAIALTGLFTTTSLAGVLPTPGTLREAGDLLSRAWQQILSTAPPATTTVELSFLVALALGTTALIVDFLVAEAKAPAMVALPLLCLYSVPASVATEQIPWWTFAAPAGLYALLLAVTSHAGARARGRTTVGLAGAALAIAAFSTAVAVLAGDAVHSVGTEGRLPRTPTGGSEIGLSPFTSLRGDLTKTEAADLLQVNGLDHPDYLRTVTLNTFVPGNNGGWRYSNLADDPIANGPLPGADPGRAAPIPVRVSSLRWADQFLPLYERTVSVSGLAAGWRYDPNLGTMHREAKLNPRTYTLRAAFPKPTEAALRADTTSAGGDLTELPAIPETVSRTAQSITAGLGNSFDKTNAVLNYFIDGTNGFRYSLTVPSGTTGDPLSDFLQVKTGFCEQYASTMAVMLRSLGIPARVAVGFTQGTLRPDGSYLITTHDAHAWVEVLFDTNGWVRFDPTPLTSGQGTQQGFAEGGEVAPATTEATQTTIVPTTLSQTARQNADTETVRQSGQAADTSSVRGAGSGDGGSGGIPSWLWWSLLVILLAAAVLSTPRLVRRWRQQRRWAAVRGGGPTAATSAWAELEDLLVDHGVPLVPTETPRATANRIARTQRLNERARSGLRDLVLAAEREWYGPASAGAATGPATGSGGTAGPNGRPAAGGPQGGTSDQQAHPGAGGTAVVTDVSRTPMRTADQLIAAVREVAAALQRSAPLSLLDRLMPRSLRPGG